MTTRRSLFLSLGATALIVALAVPVAFSGGPRGGPDGDGPRGDRIGRLAEKLGLDAKQTAQLKALKETHQTEADSIREQIDAKREATKALWLAPNPNKAQILASVREVQALEGQLAESRVDFMFAARGVLNPSQFAKFVEMRRHHGKKGWGRGEGRGMRHHESPDSESE